MFATRIRQALQHYPLRTDAAMVVVLAGLGAVSGIVLVAPRAPQVAPSTPMIVLWAFALALPLLCRRRFPCTVLVLVAVHFPFYWAVGRVHEIASWLVLGIAVYSAAAYGDVRRAACCAGIGLAGLTLLVTVSALVTGVAGPVEVGVLGVLNALPYLLGWSLGLMTRRLREYRAELQARNRELAEERESSAHRAVLEERVRIARELHDVVAHHVSLMGIQAAVAQRLFHRKPDDALEAVSAVQDGSRQVIADLQQLLGVLRGHGDDGHSREPAPGLRELPALVASVRQAGLPVDLDVRGGASAPAPGLELSAYRIVQEALTNSLKHARAARARVTVRCGEHAIEVEVVDDGCGPRASDTAGGRGLLGMQERVSLHGGRLDVGARPEGGFRVHAVLGCAR